MTEIPALKVNEGHVNSDVDSGALAQHHTLGGKPHQAAPGDHKHNFNTKAKVFRTAALSPANATNVFIPFDAESYDPHGWHDNSTNPDRITVNRDGKYRVLTQCAWASNSTGYRTLGVEINGVSLKGHVRTNAVSGTSSVIQASAIVNLLAGEYFRVLTHQTSGAALALVVGEDNVWVEVEWVGDIA